MRVGFVRTQSFSALRRGSLAALAAGAIIGAALPFGLVDAAHAGARKTVAVAQFDGHGAFVDKYGSWDEIGGGLAAMLVTELDRSGHFNVVDRADVDAVLREQQYSESGLTATRTVRAGKLLGAQFLVRGSVTEFDDAESGGGFSIGGAFGGVLGSISPQSRSGHVAIDVRVIDTTTGQVVHSYRAESRIEESAIAGSIGTKNLSLGADHFDRTPLGKAARAAIAEAVHSIIGALTSFAWEGAVAKVNGGTLYVNAGMDSGLVPGDVLTIYRVVDQVTDPVTGEILGLETAVLGQATITQVQSRYATARFATASPPQVGDVLRLAGGPGGQLSQIN
jgi:curli biogenesis system outer membrane secretion channel CsgG